MLASLACQYALRRGVRRPASPLLVLWGATYSSTGECSDSRHASESHDLTPLRGLRVRPRDVSTLWLSRVEDAGAFLRSAGALSGGFCSLALLATSPRYTATGGGGVDTAASLSPVAEDFEARWPR